MKKKIALIIIIGTLLVAAQFFLSGVLRLFEGTDDQSVAVIEQVSSGYEPWFESIWEPSSDVAETILFALQTLIGMIIIIAYVVYNETRRQRTKTVV